MVDFTLNGSIRKDLGSSNTNRLKQDGFIPAVIYGDNGKENTFISIIKKEFDKEYLKGGIETKTIELIVDKKKYKVIAYQLDIDPVSDLPRHIDFVNLEGKKEVKTIVPVKYTGQDKSPGLKKGGFLNVVKRKLFLFVDSNKIPQSIEVDISKLHIGSNLKINDINLPEGVKSVKKDNYVIVSITGKGKSTEDDKTTSVDATTDAKTPATAPVKDAKAAASAPAKDAKAPAAKK
ncbi:MAG: 50S ribosomal protein L25/general stress protein Ctc [Rickettsiales bacterium]|jgi:large subunit ribosomal protein L25|nr:50S ribosomal protein L25/general stress protein Ctc [Rickettsiales bacterium]